MDSSFNSEKSSGVKSRTVKEIKKQERASVINNSSEKSKIRRNHSEYLRSCFNIVKNKNELKKIHEEKRKLAIDSYIAEISVDDEEKEKIIKQFCEDIDKDFEGLISDYKTFIAKLNSVINQSLENAKLIYKEDMDKHFAKPEFIYAKDLQELHEKAKSFSHYKLEIEFSLDPMTSELEEQFNTSIENIYDNYKKLNLMNIPLNPAIGIDLGTTYSCVGVMKKGKVHIIQNTYSLKTTPSYISFTESDEVIVGKSAKEQSYLNPANTIYDVKRMIGRDYNDIEVQNDMRLWPFNIIDENGSLKIKLRSDDNITLYPEELSAKILSKLKNEAEDFLGCEVKNAVITVPAYFNDAQKKTTKKAGILAKLNVLQILNEPTAAAIAYSHQIKDDFSKNVLIYDLGGGTFDVAIIVIENEKIIVKAVSGDTHLGGVDFDQRILDFILKKFADKFSQIIEEDKDLWERVLSRLKISCEKKKWELSEMSSSVMNIDCLLPGWDFKYELTRNVFDELCIDLFEKTITIVGEALSEAKINRNEIDDIVLVGGSTKIPKIRSLLKSYFIDKHLNREINPDEAVAYGATIHAALLNGETFINSNIALISDVSPLSLGIEVLDKSMSIIIPRNTKIPTERSQVFQTSIDNQTFVLIQIFEGENKKAKMNRLLGEFVINGLPKKRAGKVTVEVTIKIDKEGIMHIEGVSSNKSANLTITEHRGRISTDEMRKLPNKVYKEK